MFLEQLTRWDYELYNSDVFKSAVGNHLRAESQYWSMDDFDITWTVIWRPKASCITLQPENPGIQVSRY